MTQSPTLIQALASALKDAVKVNGSVQVRPAAVLWTDAEAQWASVLPRLRAKLPSITQLGAFKPSDLRAIESCPRDLQPLAELQYRGVFWSQLNGKDWTVSAFLASKNGGLGLGLDVAQDKAT